MFGRIIWVDEYENMNMTSGPNKKHFNQRVGIDTNLRVNSSICTAQKMKFFIKDLFNEC